MTSSGNRVLLIFRRLLHACEQIHNPGEHEGLVESSCALATSLRHLKYAQYIKQLSDHFDKVQKLKGLGKYNSLSQSDMDDFARRVRELRSKSKALLAPPAGEQKQPTEETKAEAVGEVSCESTASESYDNSPRTPVSTVEEQAPIRIRFRNNFQKSRTTPKAQTGNENDATDAGLNNILNALKQYKGRAEDISTAIGEHSTELDKSKRLIDESSDSLEDKNRNLTKITNKAVGWKESIFLVVSALVGVLVTLIAGVLF